MFDVYPVLRVSVPRQHFDGFEHAVSPSSETRHVEFDLINLYRLGIAFQWLEIFKPGMYIYECRQCIGCGCEAFLGKDGIPEEVLDQLRWHAATCGGK